MADNSAESKDLEEVGRDEPKSDTASEFGGMNSDVDSAFTGRMERLIVVAGGVSALAKRSGVSRRMIDKYRAGTEPSRERLVALAKGGPVSLVWLATGEGPIVPDPVHPPEITNGEFVALPRYGVEAAAGIGSMVESEHVVDYLHFRHEWLRRTLGVNPARLVLLEAAGDSMADTIKSGDLLIVDASEPAFRGDGIYVINVDESLMVKRVGMRLAGGVRISSDNPRYPETLEIARDDVERRIRFVGKVVWKGGEI